MTPALMYHELQRHGHPSAQRDPGYVRYVVDESRFAAQLAWMAGTGLRGVALGDALGVDFRGTNHVVITFDDGAESDLTIAAPALREVGFSATFYVVSEWIGRRAGFLRAAQLRELADAGFEIGSHSATHAFLSDLPDDELRRELTESKARIEDCIGRGVRHVSCPGGRTSRRVADAARRAGYMTMATSRVGVNGPRTNRFRLARCAVQRATTREAFASFCRGTGLVPLILRDRALAAAKVVAGNRLYASIRGFALRVPRSALRDP